MSYPQGIPGSLIFPNKEMIHQYAGTINLQLRTPTNLTQDLETIERTERKITIVYNHMVSEKLCLDLKRRIMLDIQQTRRVVLQYSNAINRKVRQGTVPILRRSRRSSRKMLQSIHNWLIEGDEDFNDVRENEIQVDNEIEKFRHSYNSLVASERALGTAFEKMRSKVRDMDKSMAGYNYESLHQYGHLIYYLCVHALETMEKKYEKKNPMFY